MGHVEDLVEDDAMKPILEKGVNDGAKDCIKEPCGHSHFKLKQTHVHPERHPRPIRGADLHQVWTSPNLSQQHHQTAVSCAHHGLTFVVVVLGACVGQSSRSCVRRGDQL